MQKVQSDNRCVMKFKPAFNHALYQTSVSVIGKNLSGLLLIKRMPDSSTRIVCTNPIGISYFDFGFYEDGRFTVYQVLSQMNRKAVIKTLRKDFELILFMKMDSGNNGALHDHGSIYHAFPQDRGVNYYITDSLCDRLVGMQRASDTKPVMVAYMQTTIPGTDPDSISIRHLNFDMTITLKKIPGGATE